jgi:hypothetical protein
MSVKCVVNIASMPVVVNPDCSLKLFVIGADGKGYHIKPRELYAACLPIRVRQKTWVAPGSGTLATAPFSWPADIERVMLYYNGQLITETTTGGSDWTASGSDNINYPAGFEGGELTVVVLKYAGE